MRGQTALSRVVSQMRWIPFALVVFTACQQVPVGPPRDWAAHPVFHLETTTTPRVWVVSDVHGGFDRLVTLLRVAKLIDATNAWIGGSDRLYVLGDLIDKATGGLQTIELLQALQEQGANVVVMLGNHEAEFLADPSNDKATLFVTELRAKGLDPLKVASGEDVGAWLRNLPAGAKDGTWFFSHAGNTAGKSLETLGAEIQAGVDAHQFDTGTLLKSDSILEAQQWWASGTTDSSVLIDANLAAIDARHVVFGHDPSAFGKKGTMAEKLMGRLFLVDVGMSPAVDDSKGALLLIERSLATTTVSAVTSDGSRKLLFQE